MAAPRRPRTTQRPSGPRSTLASVAIGLCVALVTFFGLAACGMIDGLSDAPGTWPVPSPWGMFGIASAFGSMTALFASRRPPPAG